MKFLKRKQNKEQNDHLEREPEKSEHNRNTLLNSF